MSKVELVTVQSSATCPRVKLTVETTSSTGNTQSFKYSLIYETINGNTISSTDKKSVMCRVNGALVFNADIVVRNKTTYTLMTGAFTVNKASGPTSVALSVSIDWGSDTWNGTTLGLKSATGSISVPAKSFWYVYYDANGGSGAPNTQYKYYNENLTLSSTVPTKSGYSFQGWSKTAGSSTVDYRAGSTYSTNATLRLYAVWNDKVATPKISNATATRCDSSGNDTTSGYYANVSFEWSVDPSVGSNYATINGTTVYLSGNSGIKNYVTYVGGSSSLSISVKDNNGNTSSRTVSVVSNAYTLDFANGGTGIGVGCAAPSNGIHIAMPLTYESTALSSGNCNALYEKNGTYYIGNSGSNKPGSGLNGWLNVKAYGTGYCYQEFITYTGLKYYRVMDNGSWSAWRRDPIVLGGMVTITSTSTSATSAHVTFNISFPGTPTVTATPITATSIGKYITGCSIANVSSEGFDCYTTRTDATSSSSKGTNIYWTAVY